MEEEKKLSAFNEANGHYRKEGGKKKKKTGTSREKKKIYEMINQNMKRGNIKNKKLGPTKNGLGFFLNYFSPFRPVYMPEYTLRNMCNTSRLPCNRPRKVEI
jgi:hypothetical protein